jgi:hypothetical protein
MHFYGISFMRPYRQSVQWHRLSFFLAAVLQYLLYNLFQDSETIAFLAKLPVSDIEVSYIRT